MRRSMQVLMIVAAVYAFFVLAPSASAQTRLHTCSNCHSLHGSELIVSLPDDQEILCASCHDGITVPGNIPEVHNGARHAGAKTSCRGCHDHFGETIGNIKLIPTTLNTPNSDAKTVLFEGSRIFAEEGGLEDGVCEVCHTETDYHRNTGPGPGGSHNSAADCTTCHTHDTGFAPPSGGGCSMCHDSTQGSTPQRRAVFPELNYTSHHIDWATAGYAGQLDVPPYQCQVCHSQATHQGHVVMLNDVDAFETTEITTVAASDLDQTYFILNTVTPESVGFWIDLDDGGSSVPGALSANRTVEITTITTAMTAAEVATEVAAAVHEDADFVAFGLADLVTVKSFASGDVAIATPGNSGFTVNVVNEGDVDNGPYDATDPSQAASFCLGCHDNNGGVGAGGIAPFADGVTPPVIDAALWDTSSHGFPSASKTCLDCHMSGHGSQKAKMLGRDPALTPYLNSGNEELATQYSLKEQEEEFCFNCHNSTVFPPAVPPGPPYNPLDMKSLYDLPVNWAFGAAGASDIPFFNDRHDVQYEPQTGDYDLDGSGPDVIYEDVTLPSQMSSGVKIECSNCHDPHSANGAQPWKSDPDTSENAQATSGVNDLSNFCLDCHDGSFPAGIIDYPGNGCRDKGKPAPCPPMTDIDGTWMADGMGGRDASGSQLSTQPNGWTSPVTMSCDQCHSPHPSPTYAGATLATNLWGLKTPARGPADHDMLGWGGSDWTLTDYSYSYLDTGTGADVDNGSIFCNSCHNRPGMIGGQDCTGCHIHSDGGRF